MANSYKTPSMRGPNLISQVGAGKRMVSQDGLRWAFSRNAKRSMPDKRFDSVEVWTLKERVNGKAVTVDTGISEEGAMAFLGLRKEPAAPECDKLVAVAPFSNKIGEFVDWLKEREICLGAPHEHDEEKCGKHLGFWECGFSREQFVYERKPITDLLAEFFEIDMVKVENERSAILEAYRKGQADG